MSEFAFVHSSYQFDQSTFGNHIAGRIRSGFLCSRTVGSIKRPPQKALLWNMASSYITRDNAGFRVLNVRGMSQRHTPLWLLGVIACGFAWIIRRIVILRHLSRVYRREDLNKDIADFYDLRSAAWETVWGEHMHHGLYDVVDGKRLRGSSAQCRTMSELLLLSGLLNTELPKGAKVLDVGCGIGGASRFMAKHFGPNCEVTGITLSQVQAQRATEINKEQDLSGRVKNEVRNALSTGFPDNHFDVVWSMESGEHMENKQKFIKECTRVLKPGGRLVMLVWCLRETSPPLRLAERFAIRRIMEEYCLPRVAPASEYDTEMVRSGLRGVKVSDWTKRAAPFWWEVAQSVVFNPKGWAVLWQNGWPLLRSALAMRHVIAGIREGVFRLMALSAKKMTVLEQQEEEERAVYCCCSTSSLPVEK